MIKAARYCFLIAISTLLLANPCLATPGPMDKVKLTVAEVLEILRTPDLDRGAKRQMLSTTIGNAFNFKSMAQRILAQKWKKTSPQEREQFIELLSQLLEQNYIGNLDNYSDEKVEFVKERIKKKNAAIDTLIMTKSKEIPVSYRLLLKNDEWKVYDVIIESVSFVNNYRNSYGQILKKDGMPGLLAKMENKLAQLQQDNQGQ